MRESSVIRLLQAKANGLHPSEENMLGVVVATGYIQSRVRLYIRNHHYTFSIYNETMKVLKE
jgi:hypothetical protein